MRILVVEDEHRIANAIKKGLEQEKYAVDVAYTGETGWDLASSEEYDAIILDLMLPGIDGLTICRNLRQAGKQIPILILTAKDQTGDKVEGLNSGADDYLVKPFAFEELLARIRALVRRPKNTLNPVLKVAELELNTSTYEVKMGEKQISLSNKEFSLTEYLMRNAGKVLTKDQIISHVWNYDADVLPNTVEVYVKALRRKIGQNLIKTVRGFGYKMHV
ncbi:MAG: Two component transcriptional regulator, winged helix family [Candidatus Amesbacteria bacterium GW2011_GWA1_46_35]|uniref:Two component transcriptional regulator, winged helix family n=1 Tax=Candidatus Amesbacteria bacterium GW2011_GWC2_45_19 TaxID=1618366 RepID=A0A0G1PD85_9BACT|nr:MAG: Two component transcriptional regulator, winged helix family [Candidatus Amesbacteria bacterium GW2011_GWC2_45_19]KKU38552.1 MAG: Two component transcriptional regulator, winged helix family [Candidatus Amesbacteria bacterium GW2011_GWA1_46_35]KKU69627.1 MAG: Two component transcriptional regulator, winged helix family [Microgenomates group bacterium GW2011_GWC1_47_20]